MNNIFPAVKAIIEENGKYLVIKQKIGDVEIWDFPGGKMSSVKLQKFHYFLRKNVITLQVSSR